MKYTNWVTMERIKDALQANDQFSGLVGVKNELKLKKSSLLKSVPHPGLAVTQRTQVIDPMFDPHDMNSTEAEQPTKLKPGQSFSLMHQEQENTVWHPFPKSGKKLYSNLHQKTYYKAA